MLRMLLLGRRLRTGTGDRVECVVAVVVIFLVIRKIFAGAHVRKPLAIILIPFDGLADALFQRNFRLPTELRLDFCRVQSIAAIVTGTVGNIAKQGLWLASQMEQTLSHGKIFFHVRTADIVDLADSPSLKDCQNSAAIVFHVQPVALLLTVAIDGKWLTLKRIGDHEGQELFWKLIGAVIVRGTRKQSRKFVGANVRANQEIRSSFGG